MATVKFNGLNKIYDNGFHAVHDVYFKIEDKEFVVLVGPSGCGKTTTLRMVAGLEDISTGELLIDDKVVNDIAPKDRDIAMVFQNYALYPHMSVYDNMAFGLKIRKYPKQEIDSRVKNTSRILEIEQLLDRKPRQLSGGQRQRVAVGRAIVRRPKVFLFDEPLSNLDAKLRVQMRAELSSLHSRLKATMIYVTHDQIEAMTMGDKIVVMKLGLIQQIGDPMTLYNQPINKFVAGFIGSPPMNFLSVTIIEQENELYIDEGNFKLLIPEEYKNNLQNYINKNISIGIRPENLDYVFDAEEGTYMTGNVEVIEPLGAETHIYIRTGKHQIIARVDPNVEIKEEQRIKLLPKNGKLLFFDDTEEGNTIGNNIDPFWKRSDNY